MTPDVNVNLIDFHSTKANELIVENEDGSYTILINSRSASNKQLEAYHHALEHIKNRDFQKQNVQQIESVAHASQRTSPIEKETFIRKRRKRRNIRKEQAKRTHEERIIRGWDVWEEHEQHWLDPEYKFW